MDAHKNLAVSSVATAPLPALSGVTLVVAAGQGARYPATPFNATVWPAEERPTPANAEIVRVTGRSTDTLTITRAQEGTSARTIVVGDLIAATITVKLLTDIEEELASIEDRYDTEPLNVKDFGAVGDGVTDDSAAFQAARNAINASTTIESATNGVRAVRRSLYVPEGSYLVTQPGALLDSTSAPGGQVWGVRITGAGKFATTIHFAPTAAGALMDNQDKFLITTVENLSFHGDNANATFLKSVSQGGGAQNYTFRNVSWTGTWTSGIRLEGNASADNNSEFLFDKCAMWGNYSNAFLHSGAGGAYQAQDQFLNFDFDGCEVTIYDGTFLKFDYGGGIRFRGGSLILLNSGILFDLNTGTHFAGVTQLNVNGARVELRPNCKLIESDWKEGNISFSNCRLDGVIVDPAQVIASFFGSGDAGPMVVWDNCTMSGLQEYKYDTNTWNAPPGRATYRDCNIPQFENPGDSVVHTSVGGTPRIGGGWLIAFERCRGAYTYGSSGHIAPFEVVSNWQKRMSADVRPLFRALNDLEGRLPGTSVATKLPLNAVILSVWWYLPAGVSGAYPYGNWSYTLNDADGTAVGLLADAVNGQDVGFNVRQSVGPPHVCSTNNKRTLTLTSVANGSTPYADGLCVIEYLPGG